MSKVLSSKMNFSKLLDVVAEASKCERKKVGAILVSNNRIISTGYNGTPPGHNNCCEEDGVTKDTVIHAEINAILTAAREGISTNNTELYCTMSPCVECAKAIMQAGITKVYYKEVYRDTKGINLLADHMSVEEIK